MDYWSADISCLVKGDVIIMEKEITDPRDVKEYREHYYWRTEKYKIIAKIIDENVGPQDGNHSYKIRITHIKGPGKFKKYLPFEEGKTYQRYSSSIRRLTTKRLLWQDENAREEILTQQAEDIYTYPRSDEDETQALKDEAAVERNFSAAYGKRR